MSARRVCAVVPAAGRGSRFGVPGPKLLVELTPGVSIWAHLKARLIAHVERIVVVLAPDAVEAFEKSEPAPRSLLRIQEQPAGMGDAVFCAESAWADFDSVLVVWGDQVGLSAETVRQTLDAHARVAPPALGLPLVEVAEPYVQYDFDAARSKLIGVRQSREGDVCDARGLSDVGCFALSTRGLGDAWRRYSTTRSDVLGKLSGELNFLPFLAHLSHDLGWQLERVAVGDPDERWGVNTAEELARFRRRFSR